ncbi:MAG: GIY-YIG nuclease family protein [Patescibacteria group bacterium]|nr:GIY-YIG nuclease family protein [Patescibacteria group bacterium]
MLDPKKIAKIPQTTGIYIFRDKFSQIIYIGKALNLKDRVSSYFAKHNNIKTQELSRNISDISFIEVASEVEALILEANLIKKYLPRYNISLRDDKSFLYIGISAEKFPRVLSFRKTENKIKFKDKFGPFPSSRTVRNVLKILRRIFPYCTASPKTYRPCFYSHIGLCQPCPGQIRKESGETYEQLRKSYLTNISNIRKILYGKISSLKIILNKEMEQFSENQEYENAKKIKSQISALEYITRPYYKISSFLENPNFLEEQRNQQLEELNLLLKPYFIHLNTLQRIEGIDVSNLSGGEATGSLVVFVNGQKRPDLYKRFKIRTTGPNDVAMLTEVLQRRIKHNEWGRPDLFLIDGGKPQVSQARKLIKTVPLVGLAKRLETVVVPLNHDQFREISLRRNQKALRLLQEIRDEAHRFAKSYHSLLRKKTLTTLV